MEPWEKSFVETPLRWGEDLADPSCWPPTEWRTWQLDGMPYAAARFIEGPRAATEILFTPHSVLWRHWHEAGGYHDPNTEIPWMRNHGSWSKERFLNLVRVYQHNRGPRVGELDGPQLASLAKDLMKGYLNSIRYEPMDVGFEVEVVPMHIRQLLGRR